jgi:hypothetical protein
MSVYYTKIFWDLNLCSDSQKKRGSQGIKIAPYSVHWDKRYSMYVALTKRCYLNDSVSSHRSYFKDYTKRLLQKPMVK